MSSRPRPGGRAACAVLVALAVVVHAVAVWGLAAIWIAPDEPTYGMLGRSLWQSGRLTILGVDGPFYGIVYPALAGLPVRVLGAANGVKALQILQPLAMCLTGFVVYAWARKLAAPRWALTATALSLALPAFVYAGLVMTEAVYYPIAVLALFAMARALEIPSLERQAVAITAILVAALTRLQALALLPVLITAIVVDSVFERSTRLLRRFAFTLSLLVVAGVLILALHETGGSGDLLGAYSTTTESSYQVGAAARWVLWHLGDIVLLVAGIPLLATVVLAVAAFRGREQSPAGRALLAVTVSYVVWSVLQVGVFASRFSDALLERNLFTVAPLLFLGLALWLERGAPRPRLTTAIAGALAVVPALTIPPGRLTDPAAAPQAFTSLVFPHLQGWTSPGWTRAAWIAGVVGVTALFLLVPRRLVWILPALTFLLLVGASAVSAVDVHRLAGDLRKGFFATESTQWVDHTATGPVTYLYDGNHYWNGVWIHAFWNTKIRRVAALPGPAPGPLPPHSVVFPRFDGELFSDTGRAIHDPYVLASQRIELDGTPVRSVRQPIDGSTLTLWKIDPPARLRMLRTGFDPIGDVARHAQVDVFGCGPGTLEITLLGKDGSPVTVSTPGVPPQTVAPKPGIGAHLSVPTPQTATGDTRCTYSIDTPGLVGTTVVTFLASG